MACEHRGAIIMLGIFYVLNVLNKNVHELTYDEFVEKLDKGKVTELNIVPRNSGSVYEVSGTLSGYEDNESFEATLPLSEEVMKKIVSANDDQKIKVTVEPDPDASSLLYILVNIFPILIVLVLYQIDH